MTIGNEPICYEIVRSSRARRVRLRVGPDPVVRIIAPAGVRLGEPVRLLQPHAAWIRRQLEAIQAQLAAPSPIPQPGDPLPFLGSMLSLQVASTVSAPPTVSRQENVALVHLPASRWHLLAAVLEAWYRDQARALLTRRVSLWSRRMNLSYGHIWIKDQRTRWGSCSSKGNLNFSWRLIMAPKAVIDYVVVHELCHLRAPHHGPAFWSEVERYCPEYRQHVRWLREQGPRLAAFLRG